MQRLTVHGERIDLGLGSADPDSAEYVSLAQARKVALDNRRVARDGRDPRRMRVPSFDKAQQATCAESQPRWSESGRLGQKWRQTMRDYVLPKIGAVSVDAIEARHVKRVLAPIAAAGHMDLMSRVGDRIAQTLEWARIEGFYTAPNPVKVVVRSLRAGKIERQHMRAARYDEVAAALEKAEAQTRTPPATRLALEVLERARKLRAGRGYVFPAPQGGGMLPENAIRRLMSRLGVNATPHGFRSSFKDWARNHDVDETLSEFALAHVEGSATLSGLRCVTRPSSLPSLSNMCVAPPPTARTSTVTTPTAVQLICMRHSTVAAWADYVTAASRARTGAAQTASDSSESSAIRRAG